MYTLKTAGAATAFCLCDCGSGTVGAKASTVSGINIGIGPSTMLTFWFQQDMPPHICSLADVLSCLPLIVGFIAILSIVYSLGKLCLGEAQLASIDADYDATAST